MTSLRTSDRSSESVSSVRDTIFAVSSGRPPSAIAIIRISGPHAHAAGKSLAGELPHARRAAVRTLRSADGKLLDEAMIIRFDGPASATGEDVIELHCHGGRATVEAVSAAISCCDNIRSAKPGEFTRRSFENGRIDLTEAEGLAELLGAETETQRQAALTRAAGGLRLQIEQWQARVLELSARGEGAIDYDEEDGLGADPKLQSECWALAEELGEWLSRPRVEPLRDGIRVVLAGPPNAGKSSLLNALAGEDKAIVTDLPGTTRDQIEVHLSVDGIPLVLTDTAGIRETADEVERMGVHRAQSAIRRADVLLWLGEPEDAPGHPQLVFVHARSDLPGRAIVPRGSVGTSAVSGSGIGGLITEICRRARALVPADGEVVLNRREAAAIAAAQIALQGAASAPDVVICAEELRACRSAFNRVTGGAGVEDMLDELFGRFCLGK